MSHVQAAMVKTPPTDEPTPEERRSATVRLKSQIYGFFEFVKRRKNRTLPPGKKTSIQEEAEMVLEAAAQSHPWWNAYLEELAAEAELPPPTPIKPKKR